MQNQLIEKVEKLIEKAQNELAHSQDANSTIYHRGEKDAYIKVLNIIKEEMK